MARLPSPTGPENTPEAGRKQAGSDQEAIRKRAESGQDRDKTRFFDDIRTQIKPADFQI
ncbi:hypothetical protein [Burkholderia cepacia]|uniref:hypothetical protein n=1 Tax=Burkholderia cepacia TaxID=292 RepID=UPI000AE89807|nr:hypothetical protein [Burkholderia cepacia]